MKQYNKQILSKKDLYFMIYIYSNFKAHNR